MIQKIYNLTLILLTFFLMLSCKSQHPDNLNLDAQNEHHTICPDQGKCNFSVITNQSLKFKKDEFGIGYTEFIKKDAILLKFEYQRNDIPNTVDGHYIERVYLELPKSTKVLNLKNQALQKVNLLFERVCYCKGETGFYQIEQGTLSLTSLGNKNYHLKLNFKSPVTQLITEINEVFSLN